MKKQRIAAWVACLLVYCLLVGSCYASAAMYFTGEKQILEIDNYSGIVDDCYGDLNGKSFTLGKEKLKLVPSLRYKQQHGCKKIAGGYIKLLSSDGSHDYLSFPVRDDGSVKAYKIYGNGEREFLLIRTYQGAANGSSVCDGMWLVGKQGDKYVTYATKETLDNAGLLYDDIDPQITNGQLEVRGIARYYGNGMGSKYAGRNCRRIDKWYGTAGSVYFQWDSKANWFGYRLVNI